MPSGSSFISISSSSSPSLILLVSTVATSMVSRSSSSNIILEPLTLFALTLCRRLLMLITLILNHEEHEEHEEYFKKSSCSSCSSWFKFIPHYLLPTFIDIARLGAARRVERYRRAWLYNRTRPLRYTSRDLPS